MTKLILAIDTTVMEGYRIIKDTNDYVDVFKFGPQFILDGLITFGPEFVNCIKSMNSFIDFKFYDIPTTIVKSVNSLMMFQPHMFTVHASAGIKALELIQTSFPSKLVLGVTVLSSFKEETWTGSNSKISYDKRFLLNICKDAKLKGVVIDNFDAKMAKEINPEFITVCPGFRLDGGHTHDQNNVYTLETLDRENVDYIVAGRSITESADPRATVEMIKSELDKD